MLPRTANRVQYRVLRKEPVTLKEQFNEASDVASKLRDAMASDTVYKAIQKVHKLGGTSHQVQAALLPDMEGLGFKSERKRLFEDHSVSALRPDFYRPLPGSGIIAEVERGKTITNNMDLLDLWKCHLCTEAHFLFLIVPVARVSENSAPIKAFDAAARRLVTFFEPRNYVNVEAVFLFGY